MARASSYIFKNIYLNKYKNITIYSVYAGLRGFVKNLPLFIPLKLLTIAYIYSEVIFIMKFCFIML